MSGNNINFNEIEILLDKGLITKEEFSKIKERMVEKSIETKSDIRFNDILESYLVNISKYVSMPTVSAYKNRVMDFSKFYYNVEDESQLHGKNFQPFDLNTVKLYFEHLLETNQSLSYMNNSKAAINNFSEYLNSIGINSPNLSKIKVDNSFYKKRVRFAYTEEEIYKIADSSTDIRGNVMIRLAYEGGLKREQIAKIRRQDFVFDKKQMLVYDDKTKLLDRTIILSNKTVKLTMEYIKELYSDIEKWNASRKDRNRPIRDDFGYIFQNIKSVTPSWAVVYNTIVNVAENYFSSLGFVGDELQEKISDFGTETIKNSRRVYLFSEGLSTQEVMVMMGDSNYALCNKSRKLVPLLYPEKYKL